MQTVMRLINIINIVFIIIIIIIIMTRVRRARTDRLLTLQTTKLKRHSVAGRTSSLQEMLDMERDAEAAAQEVMDNVV